jgi:serine/threonine-protein kinase HipA
MGKGANMLSPYKAKLAMAVRSKNPHWVMRDVRRRQWQHVGREYGILDPDGQPVNTILDSLANRTRDVVNTVKAKLPENFPRSVSEPVFEGLVGAAERLMID